MTKYEVTDRGRLGGTDGWADFPDDATEQRWPTFLTDDADITVREQS